MKLAHSILAMIAIAQILASFVRGDDLAFSDPANVSSPPVGAVGFLHREPDFDVAMGFRSPPPGYGIVPFYWWLSDPLTQERLAWQLEQMQGMGVSGYQINYAHSDKGGRSWGLTYPSEPPLFSEPWWTLTGWFMAEAKKQGAGISLSDYTLGFGQGWCVDKILREHPEVTGMQLRMNQDGQVCPETVPWSLNPMSPRSGKLYAEEFCGQFDRRFPGEGGKELNFFFSDELGFGVDGRLWSPQFAEEFRRRKGYDITPELSALFKDIGPRTPKIRLDYSDVKVALTEEGFFKPVFDWQQQRGMIMDCQQRLAYLLSQGDHRCDVAILYPVAPVEADLGGKKAAQAIGRTGVLETYSGGAWYRKTIHLAAEQASGVVTLDLGRVAASAEVVVNAKPAGIKVAPPWRLDITSLAKAGDNRIEIFVCNTLANHYVTIPTHYRGSTVSGLLGPVRLEIGR